MDVRSLRHAVGALVVGLVAVATASGQDLAALPEPLADPAPEPPWLAPDPSPLGPTASFEEQVVELVNVERWLDGQSPPLKNQSQLEAAAELHSGSMGTRNFFSHCDPDTLTMPGQRITAQGYVWSTAGENAAAGQGTPAAVMAAWMASPGHASNILSLNYREIGVGYHLDAGDLGNVRVDLDSNCVPESTGGPYFRYWTQDFGRRLDVYPVVIDREAFSTASQNVDLYLYGAGWANEMRIRDSSGTATGWEPFSSDRPWTFSSCGGVKTVIAEIRNGAVVRTAIDSIHLDQPVCLLFGDGFESGNTSAWSDVIP